VREFLEKLNNLKRMPRTGWLLCNIPLSEVEDVAQHSFEVATITLLLTSELERSGAKVDHRRALKIAIMHDWAEASVADFPYPALKYLESENVKKHMERSALEDLTQGLSAKEEYMKLWQEYAEKRGVEARLVHAADYLSMMVQAIKYRERGNQSKELDELWRALHEDLKPYTAEFQPVRELVEELDKRYSTRASGV
jgi:putative hydrolase of HD superfamily